LIDQEYGMTKGTDFVQHADAPVPPAPQASLHSESGEHGAWRRRLLNLLLIVYLIAIGLAVPSIWARNQLLDTDRFVRTVAPLAENEDIQNGIVNRVSSYVSTAVADSAVVSGGEREALAAVVPAVTSVAIENVTRSVVTSPEFAPLWEEAARVAHTGLEALLTGGTSPYFSSEKGQVAIELSAIVSAVQNELANRGVAVTLPTTNVQYVLFESDELSSLQEITKVVDELAVILPIVALIALIAFVVLSASRRGALIAASLGLAVMMATVLVFILANRWLYLRALSDSVNQDAARATFDILTYYLRLALRVLSVIGVALAALLYFTRKIGVPGLGRQSLSERWPSVGKLETAVAGNKWLAGAALTSLVVLLLAIWDGLTIEWALIISLLGLIGLVLIYRAKPVVPVVIPSVAGGAQPVTDPAMSAVQAPSPAIKASDDLMKYLQQLGDLKSQGLISDDEFAQAKSRLLSVTF
jgi:hypothetical protein